MPSEVKKYLDEAGLKQVVQYLNLQDYPNNDTLIAVIDAIDKNKIDKSKIFIGTKTQYLNANVPIGTLVILLDEDLIIQDTAYYSTIVDALNNENEIIDTINLCDVCVETYASGEKVFTLLKDIELNNSLILNSNTIIKLNGHIINSSIAPAIITNGDNICINGLTPDSIIQLTPLQAKQGTIIEVQSGNCFINGGKYITNTRNAGTDVDQSKAITVNENSILIMQDATIIAQDSENGSVIGINGEQLSNINLNNCEILAQSNSSLENIGVNTLGDLTLTNCKVEAIANYTLNAAGNNYGSNSRGIQHTGTLKAYNCFVYGTHSGITSSGPCYIDGGVYNGYGHGGVYLRNPDKTSYLQNAEFNWAPMREGTVSDVGAGTNGAGMYIGGANNITVYINNCNFNMVDANGETYKGGLLPFYGIVLRTSGREKNNNVYISNSYVLAATVTMFRGGNNHNVYSGIGNDFSKAEAIYTFKDDLFHNTEENYERIF